MPRPHLPHLQLEWGRKRADGTRARVYYFRKDRTSLRHRIAHPWGSLEFIAEYNALLAGHFVALPAQTLRRGIEAGNGIRSGQTLSALFAAYRQGQAWNALSVTTRRARDRLLLTVLDHAGGDADLEDIDRAAILRLLDKHAAAPHQANHILKTMRHVFEWAVAEKMVAENPCNRVKPLKVHFEGDGEEEGHQTWSEADLAQFEAFYPIGTRERLAYSVLLYTGLRIGDAAKLGRQHLKNGVLEIKTEKKGVVVYLKILKPLAEALAAGPHGRKDELAFITSSTGRARVKESLGTWFGLAVRAAGLTDRTAHGLRKAAARRVAEAGASEAELNALFGWRDPRMAAKYTDMANRRRLALRAIGSIEKQDENENVVRFDSWQNSQSGGTKS